MDYSQRLWRLMNLISKSIDEDLMMYIEGFVNKYDGFASFDKFSNDELLAYFWEYADEV